MMVTGAAQLVMAPVATMLERRVDARLLIAAGYALLAIGWLGNGFMTPATDFWGLFWQQLVRGAAVMLCLLPSTALALGGFDAGASSECERPLQSDAQSRRRHRPCADRHRARTAHARPCRGILSRGSRPAMPPPRALSACPPSTLPASPIGPVDQATRDLVAPLVERAGLVAAFNDAWLWIGGALLLSLLLAPLLRALTRNWLDGPDEARSGVRHGCGGIGDMTEAQPLSSGAAGGPDRAPRREISPARCATTRWRFPPAGLRRGGDFSPLLRPPADHHEPPRRHPAHPGR